MLWLKKAGGYRGELIGGKRVRPFRHDKSKYQDFNTDDEGNIDGWTRGLVILESVIPRFLK